MKRYVSEFIKSMLQSPNGDIISSKRACGLIGFINTLLVNDYCAIVHAEAPAITETIAILSAALLGVGILEPYFSHKK